MKMMKILRSGVKNARRFLKKAFSSVTIMVIPHDHVRTLNLKLPVALLVSTILLAVVGGAYLVNLTVTGIRYRAQHRAMEAKVDYYSDQFSKWNATVQSLQLAGQEFRQLFSLGSKEEVLEEVDVDFAGSLELPDLINDLEKTRQNVDVIKDYLRVQKDIFVATPRGYPVPGRLTSSYGRRRDPLDGGVRFHSGVDLACDKGTPIRATADGIVSHSGNTVVSGQVVVLEHGFGFSTIYAHNSKNTVKVGQRVRKGDIIGYVGSTGRSTGPHLHYEIWKDGKRVNPHDYLSDKKG
jgi:murein DD-endopeptidase MepM/ murein hydrolase activator NlpD